MAGLSADGLAGFEYDPRSLRDPRISWPVPFPPNQSHSRITPQQQGANNGATKRSITPTPLEASAPVYDQAIRRQHEYSSQLPSISSQYCGPSMTSPPEYRTGRQDHFQSFNPSVLQPPSIAAHLQGQSNSYGPSMGQPQTNFQTQHHEGISSVQNQWPLAEAAPPSGPFPLGTDFAHQYNTGTYNLAYQTSPNDYIPATQPSYDPNFPSSYLPLTSQMDGTPFNWNEFSNPDVFGYHGAQGIADLSAAQHLPNSPTESSLEVRSLSSSDNGWAAVDFPYQDTHVGAIFNPGETLHGRSFSDSSSDLEQHPNRLSWGSYVDVPQHAVGSPSSDGAGESYVGTSRSSDQQTSPNIKQEAHVTSPVLTRSVTKPILIKTSTSPRSSAHQRSPTQQSPTFSDRSSPPTRKQARKNSSKAAKTIIRKQVPTQKVEAEKKIGRRNGPLKPEQRKQACEIRKLGACIRCKLLKKTCGTGEPCDGCKKKHERLWAVPCTRTPIEDMGYFMNEWSTHFERYLPLGFSIKNIKGYESNERLLFVTHGYGGHSLPVHARRVLLREDCCFELDWVEEDQEVRTEHTADTARLSTGEAGISKTLLSAYLDKHIDEGFLTFVDEYFEGTPFLTEMLKTAYRFWQREKTPVIRRALKMMLAYNLTHHITMVEDTPEISGFPGKIEDRNSKFHGKTVAPAVINLEIKCAMADIWRELQKDVLSELQVLFLGVYTKHKLNNWPIIFFVVTILLAVWEELQFDYHYRITDRDLVTNFCDEMEAIPVRTVVGLFSVMSQKIPPFQEWDTQKHHQHVNSNPAVCEALTAVRSHVTLHDQYLRSRCETTFDRDDFDSLSSKFTSQLVIRQTA